MINLRSGVAFLACLAPVVAARAQDSGAFITRLGGDTVAVDQFTRTANRLEGDQVLRTGRVTNVRHFVVTFGPSGAPTSFEFSSRPAGNQPGPVGRAVVVFSTDSAFQVLTQGDSTRVLRLGAQNALPFLNFTWGLIELSTRRARALGGDSVMIAGVNAGGANTIALPTKRSGADSLIMMFGGAGPFRLRVDADGRILGATGKGSTVQVDVERVASVDIAGLVQSFSTRALGTLSPRDTVRATLGGSALWVDYSRPQKRGRTIFGNVVPWNQVWRTGANAATQFHTDVELVIGNATVPAGTYTLWTLPTPRGWKLIINKQIGQWGTEYHMEQDLARVDLRTQRLREPVEQFAIALEAQGDRGTLRISWDDVEASIAVRKK
jgi:DUF2911 family protein